jgi:hypothetical protein
MRPCIPKAFVLPVLTLALVALGVTAATGGPLLTASRSTCTGINCGSESLAATYELSPSGQAIPFIAQIFSSGGECLRVDITALGTAPPNGDLETVLVSPNGTTWRNDDGGTCVRCPLVKANTPSGVDGWYTVSISHFAGNGSPTSFRLRYGRYPLGNPNCASPTPAMDSLEADKDQ